MPTHSWGFASTDAGYTPVKLVLASSSPRRASILRDAGFAFVIRAPQVDESVLPGESAQAMVARLAAAKARDVGAQMDSESDCIVISADTAIELNDEIFGKPHDAVHAREMLAKLSGRTHRVVTGLCLLRLGDGVTRAAVETSAVTFARLSEMEIDSYAAGGEPNDKAGGYAIQGFAGRYISRIEGCYFNVVGLPLARLYTLLREMGWRERE